MTAPYANTHNFDLTNWPPAKAVWLKFSKDCPQFTISGSEQAFSKFVRTHKDELHAGGVIVRLSNGTWLGHPVRFRESIVAKLAGQSLPPLRRGQTGRTRSTTSGPQYAAAPAKPSTSATGIRTTV